MKLIGIMPFNEFIEEMEHEGYFCHFQKVWNFDKVL